MSGLLPPLRALERALARWEGTEAALVFSSGFAANLAVVSTLAGRDDAVFSDAWNHASLIDGCRLSRAAVHVYRHADLNHLEDLLRREGAGARRRLIVSDTVFSMDGDLAPLAGLLELAERYDALLVLDEAHATGVLGEHGRGLTDLLPAGALSVGSAHQGGHAEQGAGGAGRFRVRLAAADRVAGQSRPAVHFLDGAGAAAGRRRPLCGRIWSRKSRNGVNICSVWPSGLRNRLRDAWEGGGRIGLSDRAGDRRRRPCRDAAVARGWRRPVCWSRPIRPPSVPEGTARLRISLTAGHTAEDVARLADALR